MRAFRRHRLRRGGPCHRLHRSHTFRFHLLHRLFIFRLHNLPIDRIYPTDQMTGKGAEGVPGRAVHPRRIVGHPSAAVIVVVVVRDRRLSPVCAAPAPALASSSGLPGLVCATAHAVGQGAPPLTPRGEFLPSKTALKPVLLLLLFCGGALLSMAKIAGSRIGPVGRLLRAEKLRRVPATDAVGQGDPPDAVGQGDPAFPLGGELPSLAGALLFVFRVVDVVAAVASIVGAEALAG
mmetsp:Transcript_34033/g.101688  ORF Transcript_34033/g.101688 Transcript_34033/m.101688 type:complete len:236 (+) Transcript_34033:855-1562(+)